MLNVILVQNQKRTEFGCSTNTSPQGLSHLLHEISEEYGETNSLQKFKSNYGKIAPLKEPEWAITANLDTNMVCIMQNNHKLAAWTLNWLPKLSVLETCIEKVSQARNLGFTENFTDSLVGFFSIAYMNQFNQTTAGKLINYFYAECSIKIEKLVNNAIRVSILNSENKEIFIQFMAIELANQSYRMLGMATGLNKAKKLEYINQIFPNTSVLDLAVFDKAILSIVNQVSDLKIIR